MALTTTLNRIHALSLYKYGEYIWQKLLKGLAKTEADDEPLPFARILAINGIDEALYCCRVEPKYAKEWLAFALWCMRQVRHLVTETDLRINVTIALTERLEHGTASASEVKSIGRQVASIAHTARDIAARASSCGSDWIATSRAARDAIESSQTAEFLRIVGGN